MRPSRTGLLFVLGLWGFTCVHAQNLEAIGTETPLSVSGGISLSQVFHAARHANAAREPHNFYASGNLNIALYGWSIPLAFTLSRKRTEFSQPFNRYAIHPSWKWIKAHAGYTSMAFSPYTVNGHAFLGGGVDLTPGEQWSVSAFGGRLLRATAYDTTGETTTLPAYRRVGYGLKTRFGRDRNFAELILFRARDDVESIPAPPDSLTITPQDNAVASVRLGAIVLRHLYVESEIAVSALMRDIRPQEIKPSPLYYKALRTSAGFQQDDWRVGVGWERVDPGYRTLGAYYFNNDLENITLNASAAFLDNVLRVETNVGLQRDNLADQKISTLRRVVEAMNIAYSPTPELNIHASASTFQTYTHIRPVFETFNHLLPHDDIDTLDFTQIARNASLSATWTLKSSQQHQQRLVVNASWQDAADQQVNAQQAGGTRFINLDAGYILAWIPAQTTVSLRTTLSFHQHPGMDTRTLGPTATLGKSMIDRRLRLALSTSWNRTNANRGITRQMITTRLNASWTCRDNHQLTLSGVVSGNTFPVDDRPSSTAVTATLNYRYRFGT